MFAEAIRPFASTGYAENYFLPSGMFGAEQPVTARATVRLAGPLRHAALVENGFTGASFQTLVVDSMTGPTHVVAAEGPLPPVGSVIEVAGWVVGRPFDAV